MKTIGTIFFLLVLPVLAVAQANLDKMISTADLIFKGQAISSIPITNSALELSSMHPFETRFKIVSVLKGNVSTNVITFEHYTTDPGDWGGPIPPEYHQFEAGQPYLVFAKKLNQLDIYFSPLADYTNYPNEFRQFYKGGTIHTLDNRTINNLSPNDALWFELTLLLNDEHPTNELYAIDKLDGMCLRGDQYEEWRRIDNFNRQQVLSFKAVVRGFSQWKI